VIVAVTGGKGGVGKSTVAYNLAAHLDAVAVDADLAMADLPTARGPDLHDVLAGHASPVEAVREDGPVDLLPCGRSLAGVRGCDVTALAGAIGAVEDEYRCVVVDCPAGLQGDVGVGLLAADACVVVTTPDPSALADAMRARELARELDAGLARVVLNRAPDGMDTDSISRELGAPVTKIPPSDRLATAQENGRPVAVRHPECPSAQRFAELADAVESTCRRRHSVSRRS
jgi:septum site-determining protein MinD